MWGAHLIKHGSAVQSTIALSSGGSEYHALLRSSAHALGIKAIVNDWGYGVEFEIRMRCDSRTARGISARQGLGTTALDDDIKTAALEALVPSELEQHLAMNRAQLITYEQFRSEIQASMEARQSQFAFKTVATKSTSDPMEVDSFGKGGKKGKKGKNEGQHQNQHPNSSKDVVCLHGGKKGYVSTEFWSNPKNQSGSGGTQNKGGKGKPKNVTGKGAGSLEQGQQAAVVDPQPQPAPASSLDLASIETPVGLPHLDHKGLVEMDI